jgi:hypothetical protein
MADINQRSERALSEASSSTTGSEGSDHHQIQGFNIDTSENDENKQPSNRATVKQSQLIYQQSQPIEDEDAKSSEGSVATGPTSTTLQPARNGSHGKRRNRQGQKSKEAYNHKRREKKKQERRERKAAARQLTTTSTSGGVQARSEVELDAIETDSPCT